MRHLFPQPAARGPSYPTGNRRAAQLNAETVFPIAIGVVVFSTGICDPWLVTLCDHHINKPRAENGGNENTLGIGTCVCVGVHVCACACVSLSACAHMCVSAPACVRGRACARADAKGRNRAPTWRTTNLTTVLRWSPYKSLDQPCPARTDRPRRPRRLWVAGHAPWHSCPQACLSPSHRHGSCGPCPCPCLGHACNSNS